MSVRPPEPNDTDDDFVDARLRSALRHAPDGHVQPPAALRQAVLQAARASLPKKPTWWQRLLDNGPSMQRAWATAAGIGAFGLALNLAWHMTSAPPSDEYSHSPVASVGESVQAPMPSSPPPAAMPDKQAKAAAGAAADVPMPTPPAQPPLARRDAAPATQALRKAAEPAPAVEATAPQPFPAPPAAPAHAAPPRPAEVDSEAKKALTKEEPVRPDRAADVATQPAADKALADERRRSFAPPADGVRSEDLAAAAKPAAPAPAPAPAAEAQARAKPAPSPSMGIAQAPGATAPAAAPVLPATSAWPEPLARLQLALSRAEDWPSGWMVQGPAEITVPRRAWWQAMLAGTAGRWQPVQEPAPQSVPGSLTWHVHGADGTRFTLVLVDGQAWLQAGSAVWRAPWSVLPGPSLR
jgi:hypothetical protein